MGAVNRASLIAMLASGCSFSTPVQGDASMKDMQTMEGMEMPAVVESTCKALHMAMPSAQSGPYMIDPDGTDGPDAPFMVHCDMTTEGGGWTVIFSPQTSNFTSQQVTYTSSSERLLNDSVQVLLAYRDATNAMTPSNERAMFDLPQEWRLAAPFTYANMDLPVTVYVDGNSSVNGTLLFGYKSFTNSSCSDNWELSSAFGRLCIPGTLAPFYSGFSGSTGDKCTDSAQNYDARPCGPAVRFTIAVR